MAVPVVEGAKEKLAGAWAYLRSIPPHVWLGLGIGAAALVLAYIAWKNRSTSLSPLSDVTAGADPTSTLSPISDPSTFIPQNPQASYYNYQSAQTVTPDKPTITPPAFNRQIGYDIHAASLANAAKAAQASIQQSASAPAHGYDIHAASLAQTASILNAQHAGAVAHSFDIHAASQRLQKVVPIFKPPTGRGTNVAY